MPRTAILVELASRGLTRPRYLARLPDARPVQIRWTADVEAALVFESKEKALAFIGRHLTGHFRICLHVWS